MLRGLVFDCRYALRALRSEKVVNALIVLVLALVIGANTAIFSIVHSVLLEPLPFRQPSRILAVWDTYLPQFSKVGVSPAELAAWRTQRYLFDETSWYRYVPLDGILAIPGSDPVSVHAGFIATNLFSFLGESPILGRPFSVKEEPNSVLLSHQVWIQRFAANPAIVGQTIRFQGEPYRVVGVMPAAAQFPDWADLWLPEGPLLGDELTNPVRHALGFLARLRSGVSAATASVRLAALSRQLSTANPKTSTGWGISVSTLQRDLSGDIRPALLLLSGAASLLLLVGCANIAGLLLARTAARQKEIAIRVAVGAGATRIIGQLLLESILLALLGGAAGGLLAKVALAFVLPARPLLDAPVLLVLTAGSVTTGVLFGLAPVLDVLRLDPQAAMKPAAEPHRTSHIRSALVVLEFALTLTLVIGAALLAKSFAFLVNENPGFNPAGVLTLRILAPPAEKPEELSHRIEESLVPLPGVQTVAVTNALPLIANRANTSRFNVPGNPLINPDALPAAQIRAVSPTYFSAMQIAVKAGRPFTERDLNQPVVIINETMARRFWPGRNPVGSKFITGPWGPRPLWATVVGVVADVKDFGLDSERSLDIYHPALTAEYLVIKTQGDPLALAPSVRRVLRAAAPELAISEIRAMDEIAHVTARRRRVTLYLLGAFALLALLLALVGLSGLMYWTVAKRRRELGIRMALGAQRSQVVTLILRRGAYLALAGLGLGVAGSFALRTVMKSFVYGVNPGDPLIYVCVTGALLVAALCACYFPARQASRADPMASLRHE
jgi:predicted permease